MAVAKVRFHVPDDAMSTWWGFQQPGFLRDHVEQSALPTQVGNVCEKEIPLYCIATEMWRLLLHDNLPMISPWEWGGSWVAQSFSV